MVQVTLEQHGFHMHRSTYMWGFSNKYVQCYKCIFFMKKFYLAYFIVKIQYITHLYNIQNMC